MTQLLTRQAIMQSLKMVVRIATAAATFLPWTGAFAQSASNLRALQGLAPVSVLLSSPEGKAALQANYTVTGAIQNGSLNQPTLLPVGEQQRLALKDAFITGANASELADGLGTTLGAIYQSHAHYDGPKDYTTLSPAITDLIAYTNETTGLDSNGAKYFFANKTTDGTMPVSGASAAILAANGGITDIFGKAYGRAAGSAGADAYGDSRPFQTEPTLTPIAGPDFFGKPSTNRAYLDGPAQDLRDSPSYPSGHTTYGTMESVLLAILVPARYQQQIARAAEYGNNRIILGAHYAMDVIGGRTLALYDVAHLLAKDPDYVGRPNRRGPVIADYPAAVAAARADLTATLESACGATLAVCARDDTGRFRNSDANEAFYAVTQTYGLPVVYPEMARKSEDVAKIAPEAGYLLTAAFPYLTLVKADEILTATEGPGGRFLDNGSGFGLYSRLNLYAAGKQAAALAPAK
jgi:hypothetical protein